MTDTKLCLDCQAPMQREADQSAGTWANQKRCPSCRAAGNLAVARERNARNRALRKADRVLSLPVVDRGDVVNQWLCGVRV